MPVCRSRCSSWRRRSPTGGWPRAQGWGGGGGRPVQEQLQPRPRLRAPVGSCRALQHSNLLQCLAQCAEVTPYLLVMELCPLVSAVQRGAAHPRPSAAGVGLGSVGSPLALPRPHRPHTP